MTLATSRAPRDDLPADLVELLATPDALLWLRRGQGFAAWGEAARIEPGTGEGRFARAADELATLFAEVPVTHGEPAPLAVASFTFDPRVPGSFVRVPEVAARRDEQGDWLLTAGDAAPDPGSLPLPRVALGGRPTPDRPRYAGASVPDLRWLDAVAAVTRLIDKGEVRKVVLARDHAVWSKEPFDGRVVARRLAAAHPDCFTFLMEGLVGASPELLVRRRGRAVESIVLAGSAARGTDDVGDAAIGTALRSSGKERGEHELAVASVRDVYAATCVDLEVDAEPSLLRLANVQHLATRLRAVLPDPAPTALELAGALHPTAAVGGTPTDGAVAAIRTLEGMERGRYTGPVGWVDARGDGEFAIALRCAELSGARARLFAGAGIVAGSLPEAELEETRLKLRAMQDALGA